jgi:hypothetical protein
LAYSVWACRERMRLKIRELGTLKQIWIAEAMLQLCYHKGASMACALQRIASIQRADAASEGRMLKNEYLRTDA